VRSGAVAIGQDCGLKKIKDFLRNKFKKTIKGKMERRNIFPRYRKHILSFINPKKIRKIKIVIDAELLESLLKDTEKAMQNMRKSLAR
jgi:hypothetical protein